MSNLKIWIHYKDNILTSEIYMTFHNLSNLRFRVEPLKFLFQKFIVNITIIFIAAGGSAYCIEVNRLFDDHHPELTKKVTISLDLASKRYNGQKIWLIYTIDSFFKIKDTQCSPKLIDENISLNQIISRKINPKDMNITDQSESFLGEKLSRKPSNHQIERLSNSNKKTKLAIILDYSLESGTPCLYQVYVQHMNQPFFKESRPIFWLGEAASPTSINWLCCQFDRTKYSKLKQQIIAVIGAHYSTRQVVEFLKQVVIGNHALFLKIEAIHWLGQHDSMESIQLLTFLAVKQKNILLRKKAIFALSQINDKKAKNVITTLARKEKNQEVRQEAIFWLSQIADDDALKTLNEILTSDSNLAIKNYAVFVISQLPEGKAIPILRHATLNHSDRQIRNKAKFWLDRTKNYRVMEFIKDLTQEDEQSGSN